ncbi:hypothetical protein [Blastomonas sp.]|uniref:hypothetical protein n=1 Tax=Blastomonas sp. TaxID=1909299 RepID=UPI00359370F5
MKRLTLAVIASLTLTTPLAAQHRAPDPTESIARMGLLAPLVGRWQGAGWMLLPDGSKSEFLSSEEVVSELGGTVLLVRGKHFNKANPTLAVHDAMATIAWDQHAGHYRFRSHVANGMMGDFPLTVEGSRFVWTMDTPGGTIRYTTEFGNDVWHEIGERGSDAKGWTKFLEMRLTRQPATP